MVCPGECSVSTPPSRQPSEDQGALAGRPLSLVTMSLSTLFSLLGLQNRAMASKEIESVVKTLLMENSPGPAGLTVHSTKH